MSGPVQPGGPFGRSERPGKPNGNVPEALVEYMRRRAADRQSEADGMRARLSEREAALVREAAVMGFVTGAIQAGGIDREDFPRDSAIVSEVLLRCAAARDLYPTIAGLAP